MAFREDLSPVRARASNDVSRARRRLLLRLTATHYENFSVVTWLTPRQLRGRRSQSIYAFCRWSDDLGDEVGDPATVDSTSLELVAWRAAGAI